MNASQRRRILRKFPHIIKLVATTYEPFFMHDDKIEDARKWCSRHFNGKYQVTTEWDHAEFKFATEKDAVIFALKWL
jgi:hypothetical protein